MRKPKATIRKHRWDTWRGYVGGARVIEFVDSSKETAEQSAKRWLKNQKNTVQIDVSGVPEARRAGPDFVSLLENMQQGCTNPQLVQSIAVHEAAHAFFLGHAGFKDPVAVGPRILYDPITNKVSGQGAAIKFNGKDDKLIASINSYEWLGRVAKGYAAGGVAARELANSLDRGDGDDRDNFERFFAMIKASNPSMTITSGELWQKAQEALAADLKKGNVRKAILDLAEAIKPDLFHVS